MLHRGFYRPRQIIDTPVYQRYGDAIANGKVPYRDFGLEYPPGALPVFAVPSLLRSPDGDLDGYRTGFEAEMLVCGGLAVLFVLSMLLRLDAGPVRLGLALGFAALAPLLLGSVVLSRFDLWPAALTVGVARRVCSRDGTGSLPACSGSRSRRSSTRSSLLPLAGGVGVAPRGTPRGRCLRWDLRRRRRSPASCRSSCCRRTACGTASPARRTVRSRSRRSAPSVLLVVHQVAGVGVTMGSSHGSQNLAGSGPDALAAIQTRGPDPRRRRRLGLVRAGPDGA